MIRLPATRFVSESEEEPPSSGSLLANHHIKNYAAHETVVSHNDQLQESYSCTPLLHASTEHALRGKTLVVKLGGSTIEHQRAILQDLIYLHAQDVRPVLVHGGGPAITSWLRTANIPTRFERGLRVTDAQTLEVVCMVLRGQINEHLVLLAQQMGGKAVGLSGTDGNMVQAHVANEHLGLVGEIDMIDPTVVQGLLDQGYIPIIAPLGLAPDGTCLNMNADLVAARLAKALNAERLVFLSNVTGICHADGTLIPELDEAKAHKLIEAGVIHGGMIPKITACLDALSTISSVHIADGSAPHILLHETSNRPSIGTVIVSNTVDQ